MLRILMAVGALAVASVCVAADLSVGPYSQDESYGAFREAPCDKCLPGVTPSLSTSHWVVASPTLDQHPDLPWLKVTVNGRRTPVGKVAGIVKGQYMIPVGAAWEFGLTATRAADCHRRLTLTSGGQVVKVTIGSRNIAVGNSDYQLPVAPMWMKGKVYVPILAIGTLLGWRYNVDDATGVLSVATR